LDCPSGDSPKEDDRSFEIISFPQNLFPSRTVASAFKIIDPPP